MIRIRKITDYPLDLDEPNTLYWARPLEIWGTKGTPFEDIRVVLKKREWSDRPMLGFRGTVFGKWYAIWWHIPEWLYKFLEAG